MLSIKEQPKQTILFKYQGNYLDTFTHCYHAITMYSHAVSKGKAYSNFIFQVHKQNALKRGEKSFYIGRYKLFMENISIEPYRVQ